MSKCLVSALGAKIKRSVSKSSRTPSVTATTDFCLFTSLFLFLVFISSLIVVASRSLSSGSPSGAFKIVAVDKLFNPSDLNSFGTMYYSQQSPGVAHKMPDQAWSRAHHPVLGPPGPATGLGPPQPSPGYPLFTNGSLNHLQHHPAPHPQMSMQHHHHQNSLSHHPSTPPHQHQQHSMGPLTDSPGSVAGVSTLLTAHWQQQLLKCEVSSL
jgi:hypothetical protein